MFNKFYLIPGLIIFSFLLRILTVYFVHDTQFAYEWDVLFNNLIKYNSYSFFTFNEQLMPSTYMPPMYAFFLYFIAVITSLESNNLLYSIFFVQIVLSTYSVYIFYELNQFFFSKRLSLINSLIFSIIPLNIYICGQISSVNIQLFFSLIFLKFIFQIIKNQTQKNIIIFSIISGLLILTRGEFLIIFVLTLIFVFLKKKINISNLIKIILIVSLVISPYVIRNFIHFNKVIIVKSVGYNLWKGNNKLSKVQGHEIFEIAEFKDLHNKVNNIKRNKYYEINRDNIFLEEAINNLQTNPIKYAKLFFKKLFAFYFINLESTYPNYYNFFHIFPIILLSILSIPGLLEIFRTNRVENKFLGLYVFSNIIIFSIFFILPRFKIIILPIQIILVGYTLKYIINKIYNAR